MIRDRLIDVAELVYAVLRAILASASPDNLPLPRGEEAAEWTLVVVVGGGLGALVLHAIYDLAGFVYEGALAQIGVVVVVLLAVFGWSRAEQVLRRAPL